MTQPLGRLTPVDLREIWVTESGGFTPWLARPENLEVLGETLGITLELELQEKPVGPFRADILCKDVGGGHWVLIENQLERTDHVHLGQLLLMLLVCRPSPSSGSPPNLPMSTARRSIG